MPYKSQADQTAYAKLWRANNPQKRAEQVRKYQEKNVAKLMFNRARARASDSGIEFSIDIEDVVVPDRCPILGIVLKRNVGGGRMLDGSPSLDRIDPAVGYVKGNVWVISALANRMKNDASPEHLLKFAEWVISTQAGPR
ncbi:hypothetical protein ACRS8P_29230 [Burkholderia cenocepacia]